MNYDYYADIMNKPKTLNEFVKHIKAIKNIKIPEENLVEYMDIERKILSFIKQMKEKKGTEKLRRAILCCSINYERHNHSSRVLLFKKFLYTEVKFYNSQTYSNITIIPFEYFPEKILYIHKKNDKYIPFTLKRPKKPQKMRLDNENNPIFQDSYQEALFLAGMALAIGDYIKIEELWEIYRRGLLANSTYFLAKRIYKAIEPTINN